MDEQMVGKGSQYPWAVQDSKGNSFDGAKQYKLHLPPHVPAKDFWSIHSLRQPDLLGASDRSTVSERE
jgi:hypothetical protein